MSVMYGIAHAVSLDIGASGEGCFLSGPGDRAPNGEDRWRRGTILKWHR